MSELDWDEELTQQPTVDLGRLGELLRERYEVECEIEEQEKVLKELQAKYLIINEKSIPDLMNEYGLSQINTADGYKITVKRYCKASIPVARKAEALQWLEDQGYGALIKHAVTVNLGKGSEDQAAILKDILDTTGYTYSEKTEVHPQTLNSFADELISSGGKLPDCFSVYLGNKTVVK